VITSEETIITKQNRFHSEVISNPVWVEYKDNYVELEITDRDKWSKLGINDNTIECFIEINKSGRWEILGGVTAKADKYLDQSTTIKARLPIVRVPKPQVRARVINKSTAEYSVKIRFYDNPLPNKPSQEHHSVTYNNDNEAVATNATSVTVGSFAVGNNTNRYMLVGVAAWDASTTDSAISSVSHNGSTTGWASKITEVGPFTATDRASIWGKTAPDVVSATVVVTVGGTCSELAANALSAYGVDQTTPLGTAVSSEGGGATATVTVSDAGNDDLIYDVLYASGTSVTGVAGADQTERANNTIAGAGNRILASTQPGSTDDVMSWAITVGAGREWVQCAVAMKASTGPPATSLVIRRQALNQALLAM